MHLPKMLSEGQRRQSDLCLKTDQVLERLRSSKISKEARIVGLQALKLKDQGG